MREKSDGTVTEKTTKIDQNEISRSEFTSGTALNLLDLSQVQAGSNSDYAGIIREIRDVLRNSNNAEVFITDQHGRVNMSLEDETYPSGGSFALAVDDGSAKTKPTAIDLDDGGYDGTYEAAKIGVINTKNDKVTKVTNIKVSVTGGGNNAKKLNAPSGLSRSSYGAEVYFAGNNNDGYIDVSGNINLGVTQSFDSGSGDRQVGDISADSGIVLKLSSFQSNSGNDIDMQGKTLELEITYEINGKTKTDTLTVTLSNTAQAD